MYEDYRPPSHQTAQTSIASYLENKGNGYFSEQQKNIATALHGKTRGLTGLEVAIELERIFKRRFAHSSLCAAIREMKKRGDIYTNGTRKNPVTKKSADVLVLFTTTQPTLF